MQLLQTGLSRLAKLAMVTVAALALAKPVEAAKPNVLFIVIADMNDWISLLDSRSPIKAPTLARLAKQPAPETDKKSDSPPVQPISAAPPAPPSQ